jgi:non-lysosomal glucosylceramidase
MELTLSWAEARARYDHAVEYGFSYKFKPAMPDPYLPRRTPHGAIHLIRNPDFPSQFQPKPGSHDDGPLCGPFLGGMGCANFSRDVSGRFSRWQLQQGVHHHEALDPAFFMIRWKSGGQVQYRRLLVGTGGFRNDQYGYAALFPFVHEYYHGADLPFELLLEYFSPVIPHDYQSSCLPVTSFRFHVRSVSSEPLELSVGLCWPNLLGWRLPRLPTEELQGTYWPHWQNAGNSAHCADGIRQTHLDTRHILQTRSAAPGSPDDMDDIDDMDGIVAMSVRGAAEDTSAQGYPQTWTISHKTCFRACQITTGIPDYEQPYTLAHMEEQFRQHGGLDNDDTSWEAHWHEPLASALAASIALFPGQESCLDFAIVMDLPITTFGKGRKWYKAYTEQWGHECSRTLELAEHALDSTALWQASVEAWHVAELGAVKLVGHQPGKQAEEQAGKPIGEPAATIYGKLAGLRINELHFMVSGGCAWVSRQVEGQGILGQHQQSPEPPGTMHFGLLEGLDTGYYYYNTLDLWAYAFPALSRNWPALADLVFKDFMASAAKADQRKHLVYREGRLKDNLVAGKLPHDMGSPAEDPWVQLNGYVHRDDPNLWKDHNPAFIISRYLHGQLCGVQLAEAEYRSLRVVASFTEAQDTDGIGVPRHVDFGDSTWDNLDMKGLSAYTAGLCIGAWAVMARLAVLFEPDREAHYRSLLERAQAAMETLWNGTHYRTNEQGKYCNATMTDSLFGAFLARKAGLGELLPLDKVRSHLAAIHRNNLQAFAAGRLGPLLVAEPGRQHYDQDGGEELQVNEVLVGSAWMFAAMMTGYGMNEEAGQLAESLGSTIYGGTGLQFRTPAAWDEDGRFRAALNMRPLAVWMI